MPEKAVAETLVAVPSLPPERVETSFKPEPDGWLPPPKPLPQSAPMKVLPSSAPILPPAVGPSAAPRLSANAFAAATAAALLAAGSAPTAPSSHFNPGRLGSHFNHGRPGLPTFPIPWEQQLGRRAIPDDVWALGAAAPTGMDAAGTSPCADWPPLEAPLAPVPAHLAGGAPLPMQLLASALEGTALADAMAPTGTGRALGLFPAAGLTGPLPQTVPAAAEGAATLDLTTRLAKAIGVSLQQLQALRTEAKPERFAEFPGRPAMAQGGWEALSQRVDALNAQLQRFENQLGACLLLEASAPPMTEGLSALGLAALSAALSNQLEQHEHVPRARAKEASPAGEAGLGALGAPKRDAIPGPGLDSAHVALGVPVV